MPQNAQFQLKQISNTWVQNANISRVIKSTSNYESWKLHKFLARYRVFKQDAPLTRGSIVKTHSLCNFNACTLFPSLSFSSHYIEYVNLIIKVHSDVIVHSCRTADECEMWKGTKAFSACTMAFPEDGKNFQQCSSNDDSSIVMNLHFYVGRENSWLSC